MWDSSRDPWGLVRGPHGHGSVNDAGKELLGFFNTYHVTVCNVHLVSEKRTFTLLLGNIQSQSAGIVLTI